jgi:hypothetical protein
MWTSLTHGVRWYVDYEKDMKLLPENPAKRVRNTVEFHSTVFIRLSVIELCLRKVYISICERY